MQGEFTRITVDPAQMGGLACIRGLRIPVATVVGMMADGMSPAEILEAYPDLEPEDIAEALHFHECDAGEWNEQMERDAAEGKLDALFDAADAEYAAGSTLEAPGAGADAALDRPSRAI